MERKPRIYVDMDDTLCICFSEMKRMLQENPKIGYPQATYGFFTNLKPKTGAIEGFKFLYEHFDVWILSRPSYRNPLCYTEKRVWVENHLGLDVCEKLILCSDKSLLKGEYLIDDNFWSFDGKLIQIGTSEFPTWTEIINYFKTTYLKK